MQFIPFRYYGAKRMAATLTSGLVKSMSGLSVPRKSNLVTPAMGYQAALRTLESQKRPASSAGGPTKVSFLFLVYCMTSTNKLDDR